MTPTEYNEEFPETQSTIGGVDLLPCPFCGGEPELVDDRTGWFVRCDNHPPGQWVVIHGQFRRDIDHCADDDAAKKLVEDIDWEELRNTAISAWNTRNPGAQSQ